MMELNIFTRKAGPKASEDKYNISFNDYWKVYFRLLATIGQNVNQREEDVLAYILSRPQVELAGLKGRHVSVPDKINGVVEGNPTRCEFCGYALNNTTHHIEEAEWKDITSHIKSTEPVDYFSAPYANYMRKELNLARSEITRLKQSLKAKRLIDDNNQPVQALQSLRQHTLKYKSISFVFPMEVVV